MVKTSQPISQAKSCFPNVLMLNWKLFKTIQSGYSCNEFTQLNCQRLIIQLFIH